MATSPMSIRFGQTSLSVVEIAFHRTGMFIHDPNPQVIKILQGRN